MTDDDDRRNVPFGRRSSDEPTVPLQDHLERQLDAAVKSLSAEIRTLGASVAKAEAQQSAEHSRVEARLEELRSRMDRGFAEHAERLERLEDSTLVADAIRARRLKDLALVGAVAVGASGIAGSIVAVVVALSGG